MQDFPPHVIELIQRQLSQFGRVGCSKVYGFPDLAAALAVSSTSAPVTIMWREPGVVIAMYGQELAGTAAKFATTRTRIKIGGQEDLFTDGQVGIFRSFLSLFGGAQNWFPIWRRVTPGVEWSATYQNLDGSNTCTPELSLAFIADADIARMSRGK